MIKDVTALKISSYYADGCLTLSLAGELDHHGARQAMDEIRQRIDLYLPRMCVIDMAGLAFMDSSGIAVVLKTYKSVRELGGRTVVTNVPRQAQKVLDAAGINRIISISTLVE